MADPTGLFEPFRGLFEDLFATRKRGKDLALGISISLLEADRGTTRTLEVERATLCTACKGLGGRAGATRSPCEACTGTGQIHAKRGELDFASTCAGCAGRGGRWDQPCADCAGVGEAREKKTLDLTIPPGIAMGSTLRLAGQGNDLGEGRGDLHVHVDVGSHATLVREGDDLRARVRFEPERAAKGGTLVVPWLEGSARVPLPAGARVGDELRMPGWGTTKLGQRYGAPSTDDVPYRSAAPNRGDLVVTLVDAEAMAAHYRVLGVRTGASGEEIRAAYRRLAMALHPERHPENAAAPEAFARLNRAYAALTSVTTPDGATEAPTAPRMDGRSIAIVASVLCLAFALAYLVLR